MTNYIHITEKYKQVLDQINTEIAKQEEKLNGLDYTSEEYQQTLEEQVRLEKDKLSLLLRKVDELMNHGGNNVGE